MTLIPIDSKFPYSYPGNDPYTPEQSPSPLLSPPDSGSPPSSLPRRLPSSSSSSSSSSSPSATPTDSIAEQLDELDEFRSQLMGRCGLLMRPFVVLLCEWFRFHPLLDDDCFLCACFIAEISKGDRELRFCSYSDEVASFGDGLSARFISEGYQRLVEQGDTSRHSSLLSSYYCEFENLLAAVRRLPLNSTPS